MHFRRRYRPKVQFFSKQQQAWIVQYYTAFPCLGSKSRAVLAWHRTSQRDLSKHAVHLQDELVPSLIQSIMNWLS